MLSSVSRMLYCALDGSFGLVDHSSAPRSHEELLALGVTPRVAPGADVPLPKERFPFVLFCAPLAAALVARDPRGLLLRPRRLVRVAGAAAVPFVALHA